MKIMRNRLKQRFRAHFYVFVNQVTKNSKKLRTAFTLDFENYYGFRLKTDKNKILWINFFVFVLQT